MLLSLLLADQASSTAIRPLDRPCASVLALARAPDCTSVSTSTSPSCSALVASLQRFLPLPHSLFSPLH